MLFAGTILDGFSPLMRVSTAIAPFALAIFVRWLLGPNRLTGWLITCSVLWFAANILMAPYSTGMRQEIRYLLP